MTSIIEQITSASVNEPEDFALKFLTAIKEELEIDCTDYANKILRSSSNSVVVLKIDKRCGVQKLYQDELLTRVIKRLFGPSNTEFLKQLVRNIEFDHETCVLQDGRLKYWTLKVNKDRRFYIITISYTAKDLVQLLLNQEPLSEFVTENINLIKKYEISGRFIKLVRKRLPETVALKLFPEEEKMFDDSDSDSEYIY